MTATIRVRDHRPNYSPRPRWTAAATSYYDITSTAHEPSATEPRHHAFAGMSLAEIDAWLTRGEMARKGTQAAHRVTYTWHKRDDGTYRAVVLYWGRWDVARSWHVDAVHPRGLWSVLCGRGIIHRTRWQDDGAYATFLMLGRVENVPRVDA